MNFLPHLLKTKKSKHFVVVDIGSYSVKVGIFDLGTGVANLIGFGETILTPGDCKRGLVTNVSGVTTALKTALKDAYSMTTIKPREAIIGIGGEICYGFTTVVRLTRVSPNDPITEPEIKSIEDKVILSSKEQALDYVAEEMGIEKVDLDIISSEITGFRLDGLSVADPFELTGTHMDVYNFSAYTLSTHLNNLQKILGRVGLKIVCATSNMYSLVRALSRREAREFHAIVVDIGGDQTDLAVVIEGGIIGMSSFPLGGSSVTRAIALENDCTLEEAEEIKIAFSQSELPKDENLKLKKSISGVLRMWVAGLELALSELNMIKTFPHSVYLTGGASNLTLFKESLITLPWVRDLPFESYPKIKSVEIDNLSGVFTVLPEGAKPQAMVPLSLGLIGIDLGGSL